MAAGGEFPRNLLGDPLPQLPPLLGGGSWAADAGIWTESDLLTPDDHDWWEFGHQPIHGGDHRNQTGGGADDRLFDLYSLFDDDTNQVAVDSWGAEPSGMGYLLPMAAAAGTNQVAGDASLEQTQVGADHDPPPPAPAAGANKVGVDPLEPAADVPPAVPDDEMEVAEMVWVAAQCGEEDDAGTAWSEEEQNELLRCLDLYAKHDAVTRCFYIAFHLPKKTALDVALRCRWLQDKKKTAKQKDCAAAKVNKNNDLTAQEKGTKGAKNRNRIYPLSKEALNSKSTKELIQDNNLFLKRIEEDLKTGQLEYTADYFYYVKTNMDAIEKRRSDFGIYMIMPPIDEEGLEEILRSRLNPLTQKEDDA